MHALIIYDDWVSKQMHIDKCHFYKETTWPWGYPGDVLYLHSRLLERAAKLANFMELVIDSFAGCRNTTRRCFCYIPTNVISITDGQIFLEPTYFTME